jgi:NAD+ dependent glucose-6-phosphate dehydrogenase
MSRLKVFLTGASSKVGKSVLPALREAYDLRTLYRQPEPADPAAVVGDLQDKARLKQLFAGTDVLIHLAAVSNDAPFVERIVPANIVGLYNVLDAAREAGMRRVVYASTCNTVAIKAPQWADRPIEVTDAVQPTGVYGVSKVFGEALGRYFHDHHGLEFIAVRIGWLLPYDDPELRSKRFKRGIWLSPRDAVDLMRRAIETPGVGYAVVFATSKTSPEVVSLRSAREVLGYVPQDDVVALFGPGVA